MLQLKQFQLFHPIGGVKAKESVLFARAEMTVQTTNNKHKIFFHNTIVFQGIIKYFKFRKLPLRFQNNLNALPPRESIKIQQFINNLKNLRNFSYYKTQNQWFLKYQIIGLIKPLSQ